MNEENNNLNPEETAGSAPVEDTSATENTNAEAPEASTVSGDTAGEAQETGDVSGNTTKEAPEKKKSTAGIVIAAVVIVVILAAAVVCKMYGSKLFNKYNRMGYIDVSGMTIGDIADQSGMSLEEFLEEWGLPSDMPANTAETAAFYMVPTSKVAESYGVDFEELKSELELSDDITEDTPWGEAEGEVTLGVYIGESSLDRFKEYYGLGDDITVDTQWKEVRNIVDLKNKEENEEAKKAQEEAENATEAPADEATEAPAEDTSADASADTAADASAATEAPAAQ